MRNLERIDQIISQLLLYWKGMVPDWRFGQLMVNFIGFVTKRTGRDIFYIEDEEMAQLLEEFFTSR